ncbi:cation:proton antiporter [Pseudomaricurvus sp.]|uniref:cation:proton antiporter n=1 Tax=Pseudomaricurvus sp. TaxID=2004510 RepID=UPI003F6B3C7A
MENLTQILVLLGVAVAVVVSCQRLHIPTSLGYLLVGVILGPHTMGPVIYVPEFDAFGAFGIVFLLFTIGLSFSLPQLHALRHQVLGLGTGQVVFTTLVIAVVSWLAGLSAPVAFVIGAVFAQSSTTIIASLLAEQGEDNSQHGRLGVAMSVFQDVTAVPFLVVIPVLAVSLAPEVLASTLGMALVKALIAFALVFFFGRWLLRPMFHFVAERRSSEMFTLTVLLVALLAAWTTNSLGLSLAFGGFLVGMMLGETEFRHQVEATIRPFRDVLLGMFFISIGMRFDPASLLPIWYWVVAGVLLVTLCKTVIVAAMVRRSGIDSETAWRTGLLMSVGGEFGMALVAIALDASVITQNLGQILIASVLCSMVVGAVFIRFNGPIASLLTSKTSRPASDLPPKDTPQRQVLICGYGRVGHTVAVLLHANNVPFMAFDNDPKRVAQGQKDGFQVHYGDILDPVLLASVQVEQSSLVVFSTGETLKIQAAIEWMRGKCPQVPVIARARDLTASSQLLAAGATHAQPEILESSLRLAATALQILQVPSDNIDVAIQEIRDWGYKPILETPEPEKPQDETNSC